MRRLLAIGTAPSSTAWTRMVGGVWGVTWVSLGRLGTRGGIGVGAEQIALAALVRDAVLHADDRINEHREIRTAAQFVDRVGGIGIARVEMGVDGGGEMTAGGEAHDAHLGRVDFPIGGMAAREAEGALHVVHRHGMTVAVRGETIFQDETGHAMRLEKLGDIGALMLEGEPGVTAAGTDDDGGGRLRGRHSGEENGQRRNVSVVGEPRLCGAGPFQSGTTVCRRAKVVLRERSAKKKENQTE